MVALCFLIYNIDNRYHFFLLVIFGLWIQERFNRWKFFFKLFILRRRVGGEYWRVGFGLNPRFSGTLEIEAKCLDSRPVVSELLYILTATP